MPYDTVLFGRMAATDADVFGAVVFICAEDDVVGLVAEAVVAKESFVLFTPYACFVVAASVTIVLLLLVDVATSDVAAKQSTAVFGLVVVTLLTSLAAGIESLTLKDGTIHRK